MIKKLFTIDDFLVAFVSALGYGYGETISRLLGWPEPVCIGASFALGIVLEEIISRITFSKGVQNNQKTRIFTYTAVLLIFLAAHAASVKWMGVSMLDYLLEEFAFVVGLPVLGFFVNLLIRGYRIRKVRSRYGDGKDGYVFDVTKEDIEEINRQNQPLPGGSGEDLSVKTKTGIYIGEKQKKVISYLGIPYAMPPTGILRWKAPRPLPSSGAAAEAKNFGPSAIQVEQKGSILKYHRQSEDCLYLNICVSARKTDTLKPVLVLFHHGDFTFGGSASPLLYGDQFVSAHPDTVFVSFNYRLGILGFIDFSKVPGGEAYPDSINLGLLDQIAALRWIKENIAAFGGDPDRITAMGFEAGAASIFLLAASPRAKGLFSKAFVFFGSPEAACKTPDASRALAESLLKETKAASMKELMQLDTDSLKEASQKLWPDMCGPVCDGTLIPADVYRAYQKRAASGIEFIICIPISERLVFRSFIGGPKYRELISAELAGLQDHSDGSRTLKKNAELAGLQDHTGGSRTLEENAELVEHHNASGLVRSAAALSEGGNKVHLLFWEEDPLIEKLGSGTVDGVAAFLGNRDALEMYGNILNDDLSEVLQSLLEKFMSGNDLQLYPNEIRGVSALDWKPFPEALVVSKGELKCDTCDTIEDGLAEGSS